MQTKVKWGVGGVEPIDWGTFGNGVLCGLAGKEIWKVEEVAAGGWVE